jgi:hypothetical protein
MSVVEREQQLRTTLEEVGSNGSKLQPIAEWCLAAYQDAVAAGSAADRESVQRQTTSYVSDAIANAAYHVHLAADSLSALLDLHLVDLQQIEAKLSVASTVCSMSLEAHNLMAHSLSLSLCRSASLVLYAATRYQRIQAASKTRKVESVFQTYETNNSSTTSQTIAGM